MRSNSSFHIVFLDGILRAWRRALRGEEGEEEQAMVESVDVVYARMESKGVVEVDA